MEASLDDTIEVSHRSDRAAARAWDFALAKSFHSPRPSIQVLKSFFSGGQSLWRIFLSILYPTRLGRSLTLPISRVVIVFTFVLFCCLASCLEGQESSWPYQQVAAPFHFHSDGPMQDLAPCIEGMAQLPKDIRAKLGIDTKTPCIHIVIFRSEAEYQRYLRHYFPQVPTRRALFIKDRGPGIVFAYRHPDLMVDLRHECTHAILQDVYPDIPLWLDEGMAEYFEAFSNGSTYHLGHAPVIHSQAQLGHVPAIEDLENCANPIQMDGRKYSEAWAWVHFLLEGNEQGTQLIECFLNDVGTNPQTAGKFSARVRRTLPNGRFAFLEHFQQLAPPTTQVAVIKNDTTRR